MKQFIKNHALHIWLTSAAVYFIAMIFIYLSGEKVKNAAINPSGITLPDVMYLGIPQEKLHATFTAMGPESLVLYAQSELYQDTFYPLAYTAYIFFTLLFLGWFLEVNKTFLNVCLVLPVLVLLADLFENNYLIQLALSFPSMNKEWVQNASLGNIFKWGTLTICFALVGIFGILSLVKKAQTAVKN